MAENRMAEVAKLFGKKLGERFKVKRDYKVFDCAFNFWGLDLFCTYDNPYIELEAFVLEDLITGNAVIVDER